MVKWQVKTEVLWEKTVPVPLYRAQFPHGLPWDQRLSMVRHVRLAAWVMTRHGVLQSHNVEVSSSTVSTPRGRVTRSTLGYPLEQLRPAEEDDFSPCFRGCTCLLDVSYRGERLFKWRNYRPGAHTVTDTGLLIQYPLPATPTDLQTDFR
jgi:hypothetical protein